MRKTGLLLLITILIGLPALPASSSEVKRLGTDPTLDGPPTVDITYLDVGRTEESLEIRIGVENMVPVVGGIPQGPGIEWIFSAGKRSFLAEAVAGTTPRFFFFELKHHTYEQVQGITGTYDPTEGFIRMLVPLELIGADRGSVVKGYHKPLKMIPDRVNGSDVDAHVHHVNGTVFLDDMKTSKSFRIP